MRRQPRPEPSAFSQALPIVLGYLPVGFAYGVLAVKAGLSVAHTALMSVVVFAGSAQLIGVEMFGSGAGVTAIVAMTFVVNLRHVLFSAALSPYLQGWSKTRLAAFAYELTDETFALHATRFHNHQQSPTKTLGINACCHAAWITGGVAGALAGGYVPDVKPLGLDFALPAMFAVLLVGAAQHQRARAGRRPGGGPDGHSFANTGRALCGAAGRNSGRCRGLTHPMDQNTVLITIFGMAAATYLPRLLPALLFASRPMPAWLARFLAVVPPAVLGALLAQSVLLEGGRLNLSPANLFFWAALLTAWLAWRTKGFLRPGAGGAWVGGPGPLSGVTPCPDGWPVCAALTAR